MTSKHLVRMVTALAMFIVDFLCRAQILCPILVIDSIDKKSYMDPELFFAADAKKGTMRKLILLLLMSPMAGWAAANVDTHIPYGLGDFLHHEVESEIVGRSYHVYVLLPDGYGASVDTEYPTIYVLDGGALFPLFSAYYRYLSFGEEVPDVIIVGVSYAGNTFEGGNFRSTDYTAPSSERDHWGGAPKFQKFLSDELTPFVENNYRSRGDRRVIYGHSIGGQFVLYTALTQPDLFWGHIASNPALHRNLPFFLKEHAEPAANSGQSKLFVGEGTLDDARYRVPSQKWIEHWTNRDDKPWQLKTMDLDGHSHMSAPPASFREGMMWLFSTE
jgi:predicted alpha/beta superfamily hydrolase